MINDLRRFKDFLNLLSKDYYNSIDEFKSYDTREKYYLDFLKDFLALDLSLNKKINFIGSLNWNIFKTDKNYKQFPIVFKENSEIDKFLKLQIITRNILGESFIQFISDLFGQDYDLIICNKIENKEDNFLYSQIIEHNDIKLIEFNFSLFDKINFDSIKITKNIKNLEFLEINGIKFYKLEIVKVDEFEYKYNPKVGQFIIDDLSKIIVDNTKLIQFVNSAILPFYLGFNSYLIAISPAMNNVLNFKKCNTPLRRIISSGAMILSTDHIIKNLQEWELFSFLIFHQGSIKERVFFETYEVVEQQQLKTAIISILIDSYAHNISAHSLAALKWWIELRHKMLDKRFKVPQNGLLLNCIKPCLYSVDQNKTSETTEKYYEALGQTDSTYNKDYYSLFDFLQFTDKEIVENLFQYSNEVEQKDSKKFHPRFPVPIDYALYPFFRFLRDKGAFWSGVTRDMAFGGETKTWYKILWEDFANNPLYLGTIAKSEGISKINIYLKVKTKEGWAQGKFVTIDMSIIDYEEKLAQDPKLEPDKILLNNTVKEDDCKFTDNCSVDYNKYSKYAFVKLGKCFKGFREILNDEENFRVFLPGGIVGEHALFTIFENTIRNIKHYKEPDTLKKIQENGIDFWISIEEDKLENTKPYKNQLFKVGVWLGHETKLITKEEIKNDDGTIQVPAEFLLFTITDNTLKPILDGSTGAPRMGGNSQDKACAAMLFNNKFSSVERKDTERDKKYFPWINFATECDGKEYLLDVKFDTSEEDIGNLKQNYKTKFLCNGKNGLLKKYFYLWRGEDVLEIRGEEDFNSENVSRFKFILIDNEIEKDNLEIKAREEGVTRILNKSNLRNEILNSELNKQIEFLYRYWLKSYWLKSDKYCLKFQKASPLAYIKFNNDDINYSVDNDCDNANLIVQLAHGGDDKDRSCNVRSHGFFWNKFFNFVNPKDIDQLVNANYPNEKKSLLYELLEILYTKILIYDNRLFDRMPNNKSDKIKIFKDLGLVVRKEELSNGAKSFKEQLNNDIKDYLPNFLIIHLSFIESLKDSAGINYNEKRLKNFIDENINGLINNDNFIFVLTSGRGRVNWRESLINDKHLLKKFIYKPVESLLNAIESGISYEDDFDVKFNLIKFLMNS